MISGFETVKVARDIRHAAQGYDCAGIRDRWTGTAFGSRILGHQMLFLFEIGLWPGSILQGSGRWAILVREKRQGVCKAVSSFQIVKPLIGASQVILTLSCLCLTLLSESSSERFAMLLYQMSVL